MLLQPQYLPYAYYAAWIAATAIAALAAKKAQRVSSEDNALAENKSCDKAFKAFQNNYLLVYIIMMGADWFQGPYMYALYDSYGYSIEQIGTLFLMGFGASLVAGPLVGAAADKL